MEQFFWKIFCMSIAAGVLTLVIAALRLTFRRVPRRLFLVLWGLVALRLVLPVTLESRFSLLPDVRGMLQSAETAENAQFEKNPAFKTGAGADAADEGARDAAQQMADQNDEGRNGNGQNAEQPDAGQRRAAGDENGTGNAAYSADAARSATAASAAVPQRTVLQRIGLIASAIWLAGTVGMLLHALMDYIRVRRLVREAIRQEDGTWRCDRISSAFILGILLPRIYVPAGISEADLPYVTAHEQAHLRRRDHVLKAAGFALLAVYWFNPLIWLAYVLFCRDIEYACDETTIESLGGNKKHYAAALVHCSVERSAPAASFLAFAEANVKSRIKNVLHYRKAPVWMSILCVVLCLTLAGCFMTDPKASESPDPLAPVSQEAKELDTEAQPVTTEAANTTEAARITEPESRPETETEPAQSTADQLPREAYEQTVKEYVKRMVMRMDVDSTSRAKAEDYASIDGYITARNLEYRREFYKHALAPGLAIKDMNVFVGAVQEQADGSLQVEARAELITLFGVDLYGWECHYFTLCLDKTGTVCTDIINKDGYDRDFLFEPASLRGRYVNDKYVASDPAYVDEILEQIYDGKGGDVSKVKIAENMTSECYTKEDFKMAANAVIRNFVSTFPGCSLQEIHYPGNDNIGIYVDGLDYWVKGKYMILVGSWETGPREKISNSLEPEAVYDNWMWILEKNEAGGWSVRDQGY